MANRGAQYSAAIQLTVTGAQQIKKDIGKAASDAADAAESAVGRTNRKTGVQQQSSLGRRRGGNFMFEMARAAEDFGQQLTISLDQAIRASANNVTQAFAVTGNQMLGMAASVTTALYFMVPVLVKLAQATDKWGDHISIQKQNIKDFNEQLEKEKGLREFRKELDLLVDGKPKESGPLFEANQRVDELKTNVDDLKKKLEGTRLAIEASLPGLKTGDHKATLMRQLIGLDPADLQRLKEAEIRISSLKKTHASLMFGDRESIRQRLEVAREIAKLISDAEASYAEKLTGMGVTAGTAQMPSGVAPFQSVPPSWLLLFDEATARWGDIGKAIKDVESDNPIRKMAREQAILNTELKKELGLLTEKQALLDGILDRVHDRQIEIDLTDKLKERVKALNVELRSERGLRSFKEDLESSLKPKQDKDPWDEMGNDLRKELGDIEEELRRIEELKKRLKVKSPHSDEMIGFDPDEIKSIDAQVGKLNRRKIDAELRLEHLASRQKDIAERRLELDRDRMETLRQMGMLTESNTEAEMAALRRAKDQMIFLQTGAAGVGPAGAAGVGPAGAAGAPLRAFPPAGDAIPDAGAPLRAFPPAGDAIPDVGAPAPKKRVDGVPLASASLTELKKIASNTSRALRVRAKTVSIVGQS